MPERPLFPSPEQVRQLPLSYKVTAPPEWADRNDHVNVQHYLTLYEDSGWLAMDHMGMDPDQLLALNFGEFDLEHHIHYRAEIRIGDSVSTYHRVLGRTQRRFHGMLFILNDSSGKLAATVEFVTAAIDLSVRRMADLPPEIRQGLDELLEVHGALDWPAPVCGVMAP